MQAVYHLLLSRCRIRAQLIWSLVPIMIALIMIQEMSARMGVVTGKGLSDLIREKLCQGHFLPDDRYVSHHDGKRHRRICRIGRWHGGLGSE